MGVVEPRINGGPPVLLLWARLRVRKSSQRGLEAPEVARQNYAYLTTCTNYLGRDDIVGFVGHCFPRHRFCKSTPLRYSRLGPLFPALRFLPGLGPLLSTFQTRVLLLEKEATSESPDRDCQPAADARSEGNSIAE